MVLDELNERIESKFLKVRFSPSFPLTETSPQLFIDRCAFSVYKTPDSLFKPKSIDSSVRSDEELTNKYDMGAFQDEFP